MCSIKYHKTAIELLNEALNSPAVWRYLVQELAEVLLALRVLGQLVFNWLTYDLPRRRVTEAQAAAAAAAAATA